MLNSEYLDLGFIPWGGVCKEDERYYIQDEFFGPSIDKKWKLMIKLWMRAYKHQLEYPDHPPYFFANHASATRVVTYQLNALGPKKYAKQVHRYSLLISSLIPETVIGCRPYGPSRPSNLLDGFPFRQSHRSNHRKKLHSATENQRGKFSDLYNTGSCFSVVTTASFVSYLY